MAKAMLLIAYLVGITVEFTRKLMGMNFASLTAIFQQTLQSLVIINVMSASSLISTLSVSVNNSSDECKIDLDVIIGISTDLKSCIEELLTGMRQMEYPVVLYHEE